MINYINRIREKLVQLLNYLLIVFVFYFPIASMYSQQNIDFMHQSTNILIYIVLFIGLTLVKLKFFFINKLFLSIVSLSILLLLSFEWSEVHMGSFYGQPGIYNVFFKSYFILPFLIVVFILKRELIPTLINSFLASMFINELISYGIYFELWDTWAGSPSNPVPFHLNHITYSAYVGFAIILSLYKLFHIQNKYLQAFYLVFFITMTINLFMSSGRTGQISLLITFILLIFIYFKKDIKKIIIALVTLLVVFILMYNSIYTFNKRIDEMILSTKNIFLNEKFDTSFGTRIMAFSTVPYLMNTDNILVGVGIGDKPSYVSNTLKKNYPYRLNNFDKHGYLHNSHIEMLVSNGLIGLFLYLSIFYFLIKIQIKDPFIKYISYVTSFYFFCYGLSADIFFFHHVTLLFSFILAIVVSQANFESLEKNKKGYNE